MKKRKRGLQFCLFLAVVLISLVFISCVNATDYYVNASKSCTGDGTSEANAWCSIANVSGALFNPGDNIYFARGETWRETLTVPSSGNSTDQITFGAYGSGAKPIINGADLVTGWEQNGTNVWNASLTTAPNQVFFNGTRGIGVAYGDVNATNKWNWSSNVLRVYSTSDPDIAYMNPGIESSARIRCVYIGGKNYITVQNINLKYSNLDNLGIDEDSDYAVIDGITSDYPYWRGVQISTASGTVSNTTVKNSTIAYSGGNGIWIGTNTDTTLIQNNTVHHNCQLAIDGSQHIYTAGIKANGNTCVGLVIEYNTVYSEGVGNPDGSTHGQGIWTDTNVQAPIVRYNKVYDNNRRGIYIELTSNAQVYYNLVWDNDGDGISLRGGTTVCNGNHIYNNVVYSNNGSGISVWGDNSTSNCISNNLIRNNIVIDNTNAGGGKSEFRCFWGGENDGTYGSGNVYEYNNFGTEQDYFIFWGDGDLDTYDLWEAAYGSGTNSVETDPLFTDAANDNFAIEGGSPCRDVGTNVGLTQDYEGNDIIGNPDIGAYEISGSWYFSSAGDDNNNSGYSTLKPLKTISRLNGLTFDPGDSILFKRNETWREQLTIPSSGNSTDSITFEAYGSGEKPVIKASDVLTSWTLDNGNVYNKTGVTTQVRIVYYNSTKLVENDTANNTVLLNQWDWESDTLYVNVGEDPGIGTLEAGQRAMNIDSNGNSYLSFKELDLQHANTNWKANLFIYQNGDGITVQNVDVTGSAHAGIWIKGASDVEVSNCSVTETVNAIEVTSDNPESVATIHSNQIYNISGDYALMVNDINDVLIFNNNFTNLATAAIWWGAQSQGNVTNATIYSNYVDIAGLTAPHGGGIQIGGTSAKNATNCSVFDNVVKNIYSDGGDAYGIDLDHGSTCLVYQNWIENADEGGIVTIGTNSTGNSIYYNVIIGCGKDGSTSRAGLLSGSGAHDNNWYNNIMNDCYIGFNIANSGTGDNFSNNIIVGSDTYHVEIEAGSSANMDYNLYWPDTAGAEGMFAWNGVDSDNFTDWQSDSGQDGNSLLSDPLFTNTSGYMNESTDFHLQSNSPCIDNGTDVGLTQDFEGNPVPQPSWGDPDIGAYEYYGPVTVYVDATLGNDSYNGLYPTFESGSDGPWKTWDFVRAQSYSAGDTIKFKRGETWILGNNDAWEITDSGTAEAYITIEDYGTGTLPIFEAREDYVGATWADEGGNVWSTAETHNVYRVQLDGVDSGKAVNATAINSTTHLWHWNTDDDKLFVYATEDPSTFYTNILVAQINYFVFHLNGCNYIKIKNVRMHGGRYSVFFDTTGNESYIEIDSCDLWYGFYAIRSELVPGGGGSANHITVKNCDFDSKVNMLDTAISSTEMPVWNAIAVAYECDDWLVTGNTFTGWGHGHCGFHAMDAGATQGVNNNIIEYNTFDGTGSTYIRAFGLSGAAGKCTGNIYRYNIIKHTNVRCQIGGEGTEVYYNLFYDTAKSPATNHGDGISEGLMLTKIDAGMVCDGNMVYNNVFYGIHNEGITLNSEAEVVNNLVKNNIFMDIDSDGELPNICISIGSSTGSGNVVSNNCFYDADTADVISYKGTAETVAEADATRTEFSSNIGADPKFTDAVNADFTLQLGSPCIEAGTDVGLTQDYAGNTVPLGTNPDIGAHEYNDTVAPTISFSCSPTSIRAGGTITCSCSATDDVDSSPSVSYTVNPSTSSAGTFTTTCTAEDDFGNSASSGISYTVSSAGGGSSGGTTTTNVTEETHSWSRITPGVAAIIKDFDSEIGIKQIQIEVHTEAQDVKIIVTKYDDKPANVSVEKSGKVYKYLQIETENLEDKLSRFVITIQVEKNWTSENDVERDDMAMFKFNESYEVWNELITNYTEENETYYYYDVELDSLSYFAIAADVVEEPEEIEEEVNWWLWLVLVLSIIIIIIIMIIIVMYKHKRRGFEKISKITNQRFDRTLK